MTEENEISLADIPLIYMFLRHQNLLDLTKSRSIKGIFRKSAESMKIDPSRQQGNKIYYFSHDVKKILDASRGKNAKLRGMTLEEISLTLQTAKESLHKIKNEKKLIKNETLPFRWHLSFQKNLWDLMEKGEPIEPYISHYYSYLCQRLPESGISSLIGVIMRHRDLLKTLSCSLSLPEKNERESTTYAQDLNKALVIFKIPEEILLKVENERKTIVRNKNKKMRPSPLLAQEFIPFLEKLFNSDNLLDRLVGVFLATGRRKEEVLFSGIFRLNKRDSKSLLMKNVSKKKEKEFELSFPVLTSPYAILTTLEEVRNKDIPYWLIRKHVIENFSSLCSGLHDLRKLYGVYSYFFFSSEEVNLNIWLGEVLGHEEEDLQTSFAYSEYIPPKGEKESLKILWEDACFKKTEIYYKNKI